MTIKMTKMSTKEGVPNCRRVSFSAEIFGTVHDCILAAVCAQIFPAIAELSYRRTMQNLLLSYLTTRAILATATKLVRHVTQ
jgi:hypothetical protein